MISHQFSWPIALTLDISKIKTITFLKFGNYALNLQTNWTVPKSVEVYVHTA